MNKIKILLAVIGLLAVATTSQAQFSGLYIPPQSITVPTGVTGNSLTNGTTAATVGSDGFSWFIDCSGTNAITTNTISLLWRVSSDGSRTNNGAAVYTNTFLAPGNATNRFYGIVPSTAIKNAKLHVTINNGNADSTNRIGISNLVINAIR